MRGLVSRTSQTADGGPRSVSGRAPDRRLDV